MNTFTRNTEGPTPRAALLEDLSTFPPGETLEERYQSAFLLAKVLLQAHPQIDMQGWLYFCHAGEN